MSGEDCRKQIKCWNCLKGATIFFLRVLLVIQQNHIHDIFLFWYFPNKTCQVGSFQLFCTCVNGTPPHHAITFYLSDPPQLQRAGQKHTHTRIATTSEKSILGKIMGKIPQNSKTIITSPSFHHHFWSKAQEVSRRFPFATLGQALAQVGGMFVLQKGTAQGGNPTKQHDDSIAVLCRFIMFYSNL